jgi:RHS repeat-associated protein
VQRAGHHLLAGAAFAGDQHACLARTGLLQQREDLLHAGRSAHQLAQLALERTVGGATIRAYLHGLQPVAFITDDDPYYLHSDRLGSITNITNETGDPQWTYAYDPYGNPITETQDDENAPDNLLRDTGQYQDPATADYHLRARTYNPTTGRFLTLDPKPRTHHDPYVASYAYADDDPTRLVDSSGRAPNLADAPILSPWVAVVGLWLSSASFDCLRNGSCNGGFLPLATEIKDRLGGVFEARRFKPSGEKTCHYCGQRTRPERGYPNSAEEDHALPWSRGGQTIEENRNHSCRTCNRRKGAKTEAEFWAWVRNNLKS